MDFKVARPDVVRAINQRWLLKFWKRHQGTSRVPRWQAVEAEDLSRITSTVSFLDVTNHDVDVRFTIRFHGTTVARIYGSTDCRGRGLDQIIPPGRRDEGLAPYRHAVHHRCPVYTIHDLADRDGRIVHYERLLLPFSRDGETVERILASFELVSLDGAFDSDELLSAQATPPLLRLSATIDPQSMS